MDNIKFQSVHFAADEQLQYFAIEKVSKLFNQDNSIIRANITLLEGASGNPENKFCEIMLSVPGENKFIKKNSEDYHKSILSAVTGMQKILRREKTKRIIERRK